jgi:cobalamin synthase
MDDSHTGVFGLIAIVLVLFQNSTPLKHGPRPLADLASRILAVGDGPIGYRSKAAKDGLSRFTDHLQTSIFSCHVADLLLVRRSFVRNIVMMAWVAVFTVASKAIYIVAWAGYGDTLGAVGNEQASVMVLLAL